MLRGILLCFLIYFGLSSISYAAPCYGTKMPKQKQLFAGMQTYSVLKRNLEGHYGRMRSLQQFVLISFGFSDWFSLDLKGGVGDIEQRGSSTADIDYSLYLGGGYGFRIKLYDYDKAKAVFGFQHISIHPHKSHEGGIKNKAVLDDWQFSLLGAYEFSLFTPYAGIRWSRMDYINWVNGERNRVQSDLTDSVGIIAGVDIPINDKSWLNFEGQFLDAKAVAVSLNCNF